MLDHNTSVNALIANRSIQNLDLSSKNLQAGDYKTIAKALVCNTWLEGLDLSWNLVGDEGAQYIRDGLIGSSTLRSLCLAYTEAGLSAVQVESICEGLKQNTTLHHIDLSNNRMDTECWKSIVSMLSENMTLQTINLSYCSLSLEGIQMLTNSLRLNSSLKHLDLSYNVGLGADGASALADMLKHNSSLQTLAPASDIFDTPEGGQAFADGIRCNKSLRILKLSRICDGSIRLLADALNHANTLEDLTVSCAVSSGDRVEAIRDMLIGTTSLVKLDIAVSIDVGLMVADVLNINSTLKALSLNCELDTGSAIALGKALETNHTLEELVLKWGYVEARGLQALARGMQSNRSLTKLDLGSRSMEFIDIGTNAALLINTTLKLLNLAWKAVGGANVCAIAKHLTSSACLQELYLSECGLRDDDLVVLASALIQNISLKRLDLQGYIFLKYLSNNTFGPHGIAEMCEALKVNTSLRSLNMIQAVHPGASASKTSTGIGTPPLQGVSYANMLMVNTSLESLSLSLDVRKGLSGKGDAGCRALAHALTINHTLRSLTIHSEYFAYAACVHDGAVAIGEAFRDTPRHDPCQLVEFPPPQRAPPFQYSYFRLAHITSELGLPEYAKMWSNKQMIAYFRDVHVGRIVAFAMGLHVRLGEHSCVGCLNEDAFICIYEVYFRLRLGSLARDRRDG